MSDFLRNHGAHVACLKEAGLPEVLMVNGRAEVVVLDTRSYESLMERVRHTEEVSQVCST